MAVNGPFWLGTSWKMNMTIARAAHWVTTAVEAGAARPDLRQFVIPPFTAIASVAARLRGTGFLVGAQDIHPDAEGAHTGDVSAALVADAGADIAEIGHQERRRDHKETDDLINSKVLRAAATGLRPLLCVGDTAQDRLWDTPYETLSRQLKAGLADLPEAARSTVLIAYEPAWAIGVSGVPATDDQIQTAHEVIRATLVGLWGAAAAGSIPVLYGGSVSLDNAARIAGIDQVDGLFVGRAALDPDVFRAIRSELLTSLQGES